MTEIEFWKRVDVKGPDECWPWKGALNRGYGLFMEGGRSVRANRRALELKIGALGPGELACHSCDNPVCCNPGHLFAGTVADNNRDSYLKGRRTVPIARGGRHPFSKLNDTERASLVADRAAGMSYRKLAVKYGISQPSAFYVCNQDKQRTQWERRKVREAAI